MGASGFHNNWGLTRASFKRRNFSYKLKHAWFRLVHHVLEILQPICPTYFSKQSYKKTLWPLLWMGFNCLKGKEPLRGDSLLFTTKFPGVPSTHLINVVKMKD